MLQTIVPKYTIESSIWFICGLPILLLVQLSCDQNRNISATYEADSRAYLIADKDLPAYEEDIDHRTYTSELAQWSKDDALQERGFQLYRANCYSCHGFIDQPGSLPDAHKFWQDSFVNGMDPLAMYQTITRGHGLMPPQMHLVPSEKYAVIGYVREELVKPFNPAQYFEIEDAYIKSSPSGPSMGPEAQPFQPWVNMDYGDWLMKCYEFADADAEPKQISKGAAPLADEDYSAVNFAYKGIAMRLDRGEGGIARGNRFVMFDHDMLRFVGAWSGAGFIDWEDILFDGQHNVYPRTHGKVMCHTKITPGWANPADGSFADPRMKGVDGRPFGPLPRSWAHYKGFYRCDERMVIHYTVGTTEVLESYALIADDSNTIVRTLTIGPVQVPLKVRLAYGRATVLVKGQDVEVDEEQGYTIGRIAPGGRRTISFFLSKSDRDDLQRKVERMETTPDLQTCINALAVQKRTALSSPIIQGSSEEPYTVDVVSLPFDNPQRSRIRPTGIDFLNGGRDAVVCTIDGEVWLVENIVQTSGTATWQRMATGLFQPLGIKVHEGRIFVSCRDQIAVLNDLNDDGIIDHYENFNSDHQVTEHFHEFAMGLQTDEAGNFYYAKSGRHARKSLVPQHGTLLKVSRDGQKTTILANGFRAANGVCLNPDGSFYVTDQQGFWNPMNRINHVIPGGFYGNMWGYGAPQDSSDAAMQQPLCWVDMDYDRSPAELVWAHSDRWGPLSGSLLSLSYGYGKIYQVMPQALGHQDQGGIIELPIPALPTGIMRGRINPADGQLYICGMAAWATSRTLQEGGLYRIRYTGADLHFPLRFRVLPQGLDIQFSTPLDEEHASNIDNYTISSWDIKRSSKYGSDRYDRKELAVQKIEVAEDGHSIFIHLPDIAPTRIMEIKYQLRSADQIPFTGAIQSTVHAIPMQESL